MPGALPLFITGLGGLGLLGWRRKKQISFGGTETDFLFDQNRSRPMISVQSSAALLSEDLGMRRHIDRSIVLRPRAKRRQASKLTEIREALVAAGFDTVDKQAIALGVKRNTAWALLNRDKRAGPSAKIIKRILSSPNLPAAVQRRVEEYIEQKIDGVYGHAEARRRWFRDQFHSRTQTKTRPERSLVSPLRDG